MHIYPRHLIKTIQNSQPFAKQQRQKAIMNNQTHFHERTTYSRSNTRLELQKILKMISLDRCRARKENFLKIVGILTKYKSTDVLFNAQVN